jgi:hypothetical protein
VPYIPSRAVGGGFTCCAVAFTQRFQISVFTQCPLPPLPHFFFTKPIFFFCFYTLLPKESENTTAVPTKKSLSKTFCQKTSYFFAKKGRFCDIKEQTTLFSGFTAELSGSVNVVAGRRRTFPRKRILFAGSSRSWPRADVRFQISVFTQCPLPPFYLRSDAQRRRAPGLKSHCVVLV